MNVKTRYQSIIYRIAHSDDHATEAWMEHHSVGKSSQDCRSILQWTRVSLIGHDELRCPRNLCSIYLMFNRLTFIVLFRIGNRAMRPSSSYFRVDRYDADVLFELDCWRQTWLIPSEFSGGAFTLLICWRANNTLSMQTWVMRLCAYTSADEDQWKSWG